MRRVFKVLQTLVEILSSVMDEAGSIVEIRRRLSERIEAGDLDDAIEEMREAQNKVNDFIENG